MKFKVLPALVVNWLHGIRGHQIAPEAIETGHLSQALQNHLSAIPTAAGVAEDIAAAVSTATAGLLSSSDISALQDTVDDHGNRLTSLEAADSAFATFQGMTETQIAGVNTLVQTIRDSDDDQDSAIAGLTTTLGQTQTALADANAALVTAQQVNADQTAELLALKAAPQSFVMVYDAATSGGNAAIFLPPQGAEIDWSRAYRVLVNGVEIEMGFHFIQDGNGLEVDTNYCAANANDRVRVVGYAVSAV